MRPAATPAAEVAVLEPWIASRLRPIAEFDPLAYGWREPPESAGEAKATAAAVLVPIVERTSGLTILLTRRAETLTRHSGQIAFPGGRADPGEAPWDTALREAEEEVGLDPVFVRIVGVGDPVETHTGFRIAPVVAFVRPGFVLSPAASEVAEVFETPFAFLMNPANHERRLRLERDGEERHSYAMPHDGRLIWGATAAILRGLYEQWFADADPAHGLAPSAQPT